MKGRKKGFQTDKVDRNIKMITEILLPDATLEIVGHAYGITRERVRQIVNKGTAGQYKKIKNNLKKASSLFRCVWCGELVGLQGKVKRKRFCDIRCYTAYNRYDWTSIRECKECGDKFYPYRSWKAPSLKNKCNSASFCCQVCYIQFSKKRGQIGLKRPYGPAKGR